MFFHFQVVNSLTLLGPFPEQVLSEQLTQQLYHDECAVFGAAKVTSVVPIGRNRKLLFIRLIFGIMRGALFLQRVGVGVAVRWRRRTKKSVGKTSCIHPLDNDVTSSNKSTNLFHFVKNKCSLPKSE